MSEENRIEDEQLKEMGLEPVRACRRREPEKEKCAERQRRFREKSAAAGLVPCSLGYVPVEATEPLKLAAKCLREGRTLAEALVGVVEQVTPHSESVPFLADALDAAQEEIDHLAGELAKARSIADNSQARLETEQAEIYRLREAFNRVKEACARAQILAERRKLSAEQISILRASNSGRLKGRLIHWLAGV